MEIVKKFPFIYKMQTIWQCHKFKILPNKLITLIKERVHQSKTSNLIRIKTLIILVKVSFRFKINKEIMNHESPIDKKTTTQDQDLTKKEINLIRW